MDLMQTNGSPLVAAADYPPDDYLLETFHIRLGSITELCNRLHANAWICIPHKADDSLVTKIATYMRDNLDPTLKVYVEYSNECWNWMFDQTRWVHDQGVAQGLDGDEWNAWKKFYAKRTAQIHAIFASVFGASSRLVQLVAWQAYNAGEGEEVLGHYKSYRGAEADALAIAPYFGNSLGNDPYASQVTGWSVSKVITHLGITNPSQLSDGQDEGNLRQAKTVMAQNKTYTEARGIRLIAYEGGQHMVGIESWQENSAMTNLFNNVNRNSGMKDIYRQYLDSWKSVGGQEFMLFSSCDSYSKYGSWGIKETMKDTRAQAPKYDAALDWITANPRWF
jgi:hypothetical protein